MSACAARAAAVLVLASLAASVSHQVFAQTTEDPAVATVNGVTIHRSDLEYERRFLPDKYRSYPLELLFKSLLDQVIDATLVALSAREAGLADDETVKAELKRIEDRLVRQTYMQRYLSSTVTEETLRARYHELDLEASREEEVHARHILVTSEAEALEIIEALKGGADFAELAAERSSGPSGANGGDLGFFKHDAMVGPFADAAFALEAGAMTESPVQTRFGWHVIKVEERRKAPAQTFEDMREDLAGTATREAVQALIARIKEGAEIQRFNLDGSPANAPQKEIKEGAKE